MAIAGFKFLVALLILSITHENGAQAENHFSRSAQKEDDSGDKELDQRHCDLDYCDTVVTKCQSTNRCYCDIKRDAYCAKDCVNCLEEKFGKCCGCVGLCPHPPHDTYSSHVGDIPIEKAYEELFETLTESDDIHGRWLVEHRILAGNFLQPETDHKSEWTSLAFVEDKPKNSLMTRSHKCAIAFINKYLSMIQCRRYCKSMGAARYRWFEDGCCECLGKHCTNYGSEIPRCHILPFE